MALPWWRALAGALVLIAGGCDADGSTASTLDGTDTLLATTALGPPPSTTPGDAATTTNFVLSSPPIAATSTVTTVPLAQSLGALALSEALESARGRWSDAKIANYRLTITEDRNFWNAGCRWITVVSDGVVTEREVDASSTSLECIPIEWTVEQLHEMISGWIDSVSEFAAPEFGEHTLDVEFNDLGVPVAMEYDLANGDDEESSMRVTFTPAA